MRKIIGGILMALPFTALALLPLYTEARWRDVGLGFGIVFGIVGGAVIFIVGLWLIIKKD